MTVWQTLLFAMSLGLGAGITPGPLSSLVINETLRSGWRAGAWVAFAPPAADVLVVSAVLLLLAQMPPMVLPLLSIMGGGYVCFLGWQTLQTTAGPRVSADREQGSLLKSFRKGLLVNLLNPHPYVFWLTVGGPLVTMNAQHNRWAPIVAFLLGFYGCLVGAKVLLAVLVHGGRAHLHGRGYRIALQVSGGLLVLFGIGLVWSGGQELRM